ncbi:MAG: flavodoxin family protein [Chloroflexota bacterium]|nr:flavodoxin family protein [Chloroflexota bacterium]
MTVLGIVGSPRKNGRTNALIDALLRGAAQEGVNTKKVYLIDYEIKPFTDPTGSLDGSSYCPTTLSELCGEADGIALGAPVYWGDINGLTKDFMDAVEIAGANGKPAVGVAIAGGTGKGLLSGVQSLYHFFYHKQMRGIDPTPVSRFNMEKTLEALQATGARLAKLSQNKKPFPGETRDACWPAVLAYYASMDVLARGPLDEFMMLAQQLIDISEGDEVEEAKELLDKGLALIEEGKRPEGAEYVVRSYQILYFPPE